MSGVLHLRQTSTLGLAAAIIVLTPLIARSPFWLDNSVIFAVFALFALSVGVSYGQGGILTMATATFAAIGGYASAIVTTHYNASVFVGLPLALLSPAIVAYPVARVVTRLSPLPLSIATLVLGSITEIAIREGGDLTGGYIGLSGIPQLPFAGSPVLMHLFAWACVIAILYIYCNLIGSSFGRAVNTIRHDPLRAAADGVKVPRALASLFSLSAAIAGLGGWLYAHSLTYLGPDSLNIQVSVQVLLMAIVGGVRNSLGPVIGAAVLMTIISYLPAAETQGLIFGSALVLILLFAPNGLLGLRMFPLRPPKAATARASTGDAAPVAEFGDRA